MVEPIYFRAVDVLEAGVDDGLVALDPQSGLCFGFNVVAADIWRLLEKPKRFDELKTSLMADYDVTEAECAEDLREVLGSMVDAGLVKT